ncbi:MAG: oligosaccharide flippase family protein [bacterium]
MKDKIISLSKNGLLKGSVVMVVGSFLGSALNYVTNTQVGRLLGPEEYGTFMSLVSLLMIISVINTSLNTTIMKFAAQFKAAGEFNKVEALWSQLSKILGLAGGLVFVVIGLLSPLVANFLRIDTVAPIVILGLIVWVSLVSIVSTAVLNGLQEFFKLTLYQFIGAAVKLGVSIGLVLWGFRVAGALAGFAMASLIPLLLALPFIKKLSAGAFNKVTVSLKQPLLYSLPVTGATLGLVLLFTMDVVLAKRFLSPLEAGYYSGLAVIGRVITFGTAPVALVMFPIISERLAQKKPYRKILLLAAGLVAFCGLSLTVVYFLLPKLVINVFYGAKFHPAAPLLGWFGLLLTLYSLCNLLTQFLLSLENKKVWVVTTLAALLQVGGIYAFHRSVAEVMQVSLFCVGGLALALSAAVWRLNFGSVKSLAESGRHKPDAR